MQVTHPSVLRALPRMDITQEMLDASGGSCPICLLEYVENDTAVVLPCSGTHKAHWACMRSWLRRATTCPECRFALPIDEPADMDATVASAREEVARWQPDRVAPVSSATEASASATSIPEGSAAVSTSPAGLPLLARVALPRVSGGARRSKMSYSAAAQELVPAFRAAVGSRQSITSAAELATALDQLGEPYDEDQLPHAMSAAQLNGRGQGINLDCFIFLMKRKDLTCLLTNAPPRPPPPPPRAVALEPRSPPAAVGGRGSAGAGAGAALRPRRPTHYRGAPSGAPSQHRGLFAVLGRASVRASALVCRS